MVVQSHTGQCAICFNHVGTQANCILPFALCPRRISHLIEGDAQLVMSYAIVGIIS